MRNKKRYNRDSLFSALLTAGNQLYHCQISRSLGATWARVQPLSLGPSGCSIYVIELTPRNSLDSPDDGAASAGRESPLVEYAFEAILRREGRFSPIVVIGNEDVGLSHWLQSACATRTTTASRTTLNDSDTIVFRGREFAQSVSHANTTDSIEDFRQKLDARSRVVFEYPTDLKENSLAHRELVGLLDRSSVADQLIVVLISSLRGEARRLGEALVSRLASGLSIHVQQPPKRMKAQLLEERLGKWIQSAEATDIQQLLETPVPYWAHWEQCIQQLHDTLRQHGRWPEISDGLLAFANEPPPAPEPKLIAQHVARCAHLKFSDLKGSSRRQSIVRSRSIAIYLIRELTGASFESIGRLMGDRDHSTIIHSYRKVKSQRNNDGDLEKLLQQACQKLRVSTPAA